MTHRTSPGARLCIGLMIAALAACGSPDRTDPDASPDATAQVADTPAERPTSARGEGTLRLGDTTYEFAVRACDFSGEADTDYQTVSGRGTTPDGETFDVVVSRNEVGGTLVHTVSFQTGNVLRGEGTVIEAQRMRQGGSWMSLHDEATEPLIRIDGNRLTASGRFAPADAGMNGEVVDGELEAICR